MQVNTTYTLGDLKVEAEGTAVSREDGVEDLCVYLIRKDAKTGETVRLDITDFVSPSDLQAIEEGLMEDAEGRDDYCPDPDDYYEEEIDMNAEVKWDI